MSWLKQIDPLEVMLHATAVQLMDFDSKYTIDDVAQLRKVCKTLPQDASLA